MFLFKPKSQTQDKAGSPYQNIIQNLEEAVFIYDKNFKIFLFNSAAEKLFSLKREEVIGQVFTPNRASETKYRIFVQVLFPSLAPAVINQSDPGVYPQLSEICFTEPIKSLQVTTTLIDKDRNLLAKIITDKTPEEIMRHAKTEFIHTAAHQLRTPITTIKWIVDVLRDETLSEEGRQALEQAGQSAQKMIKIVDDLIDASKIEGGEMEYNFETADLVKFMETAVENARKYIKTANFKIKIKFDKDGYDKLELSFDPTRLGSAVSNLLDNAIKYNVENGEINVSLEKLTDRPYVRVAIADTGIGIPEDKIDQIFSKFFRAENAKRVQTEGSGLGLYISQSIVKRHGGTMKVESVLGRGTTVSFTLPTDPRLLPKRGFTV